MTQTQGGPPAQAGPPSSGAGLSQDPPGRTITTTGAHLPALADGVQLLGPAEGSGYREPPALVRRADGQTLQLTPLLYAVLEGVDGTRSLGQIAEYAANKSGRLITAENVQTLIEKQLLPL